VRKPLLAALALACAAGLGAAVPAAAATGGPRPFGHACTLQPSGARFCPTTSLAARVPSFDGAPIDVDVTLPATGSGPWPTIVMVHGYGGTKTSFEDPGANSGGDHYNNVWFAKSGYAVVNLSVRGAGNSCGNAQARQGYPACTDVEFELGDQRYDARDVQWLLGLLVDEGIANASGLGVTGVSLGSIESLELAVLYNRIRLLDGRFAPWVSPHGVRLQIAAAYPQWAISSLIDLVAPNGRFLNYEPQTATDDLSPVGQFKLSFPVAAVATAQAVTWSIPPTSSSFDLIGDLTYAAAAEPSDPKIDAILRMLRTYHQTIGLPIGSGTAPILIEDGWDDSVVNGPLQAMRMLDYLRLVAPRATISLQLADVGHGIDNNKPADVAKLTEQATQFFDHYLEGHGRGPAPGSVTAYTATCPKTAPSAGPFTAPSLGALDPGAVRFGSSPPQTVATGGDALIGPAIDPVAGQDGTCPTFKATDYPATAVYTRKLTTRFTMLGLPTVRLHVQESGGFGQLDARLWDVASDGTEHFVSRGVYALEPNQRGTITWQLFGGGYTFPAGDTVRLELLALDEPFLRPPLTPFTATVSDALVELPSHDPPDGGEIVAPMFAPSVCPDASGRIGPDMLGPARLGMTRARVRALFPSVSTRGRAEMDFFCLSISGIRAGYRHGRAVLLLTASPAYALHGVRIGARLSAVASRLRAGRGYRIGRNVWYVAPGKRSHGVLKVGRGVIEEIGIASKRLTTGRRATRRFFTSLR
jgi:hypothetical protein